MGNSNRGSPGSMFDNEQDCCEHHFPAQDCIGNADKKESFTYYPSSAGYVYVCLSDGKQPTWLLADSMFDNEEDCCDHHFPNQDCIGKLYEAKPLLYYPSSTGVECLMDGNQPPWLPAESMFDTQEVCIMICVFSPSCNLQL